MQTVQFDPAKRVEAIFDIIIPSILLNIGDEEEKYVLLEKYQRKAYELNAEAGHPYDARIAKEFSKAMGAAGCVSHELAEGLEAYL